MKEFIINGDSWYTCPQTDVRRKIIFLNKVTKAFYHDDYHTGDAELRNKRKTVEFVITKLKNQFGNTNSILLGFAIEDLVSMLHQDLPEVFAKSECDNLTICVIPRAKAEQSYGDSQKLFKSTISKVANDLENFSNGTDFIFRHTDTRTTHLDRSGYGGDGSLPYPGITNDTCTISNEVRGKDILLIDDLYTKDVGIDEDAIQALLDHGANSVIFYSIGKTLK